MAQGHMPHEELTEVAAATEHFLTTAAGLSDEQVAAPSLLPGWSRGHVLTHVARNADGLTRLLTWARTGVETPMYPSREARDADIEAGAGRPAAEQLADLRATAQRFAEAAAAMPAEAWTASVARLAGPLRADEIPLARLVELQVHHVDLGVGFTPAHWPASFVARQLPTTAERVGSQPGAPSLTLRADDTDQTLRLGPEPAAATVTGPAPALLAWLIGRASGDGLAVEPHGPLPELPAWL